ncbi:MAG: hypothetical protein WCJ25_05195 [Candidatus Moraniibacteriota bacterium]
MEKTIETVLRRLGQNGETNIRYIQNPDLVPSYSMGNMAMTDEGTQLAFSMLAKEANEHLSGMKASLGDLDSNDLLVFVGSMLAHGRYKDVGEGRDFFDAVVSMSGENSLVVEAYAFMRPDDSKPRFAVFREHVRFKDDLTREIAESAFLLDSRDVRVLIQQPPEPSFNIETMKAKCILEAVVRGDVFLESIPAETMSEALIYGFIDIFRAHIGAVCMVAETCQCSLNQMLTAVAFSERKV